MDRVQVAVLAEDPITMAGLTSCLKSRADLVVTPNPAEADVIVFAADRVSAKVLAELRQSAQKVSAPRVLVTNELDPADVLSAVESRVVAVLPRTAATGTRLIDSVIASAKGAGMMPPDLLGELLKQVDHLQREVLTPRGLAASGLTTREVDVLRLMADGMDTAEIAQQLCYSERTVKNVIYGVTSRLNLRNRPHAVAYAMRSGAI